MEPSATDSLIQQLEESKQQASYWKKVAQQTGRLRLREAENLSALIQSLKYTKACLLNEIRDRRQAEEALRKNQDDLKAILDATLETIVLIDRQGKVIVSNKTACDRLKTDRKKIIGQCIYDFFPLEVAEKRRRKYEAVFASGKPGHF